MSDSLTPQTIAHQDPLFMEFSKQEYWSKLSFLPPGDLPNPRTEPVSLASPALAGGFSTTEPPGEPNSYLGALIRLCFSNGRISTVGV